MIYTVTTPNGQPPTPEIAEALHEMVLLAMAGLKPNFARTDDKKDATDYADSQGYYNSADDEKSVHD